MSIDPSGMAHVMSVLTNLYADAPLAVLREYATNARDSHVAAGSDRPIEVDLPSDLNPTLVIRDFGVGLSEAEIIDVYARYGASTKRDTNDQVGAFGLGCKSAFTLGQQFVVTAVKGGQRTVALFAVGGDGAGGVSVLGRARTDEPNGVLVSIGVPDVAQMRRAATGFFGTWEPGTVLVDGREPATVYAGAFGVTDRVCLAAPGNPAAEAGVHVVMGGVGYRVSETVLSGAARDDPSLTRLVASLRAAGARLYGRVAIGAVDITPSREALRDTDTTIHAVRRVLVAVRDGIAAAVQAELDSHPDIARAGFALATIRPRIAGLHDTVARRGFTWRGQEIRGTQVLPLPSYTLDRSRQSRPTLTVQGEHPGRAGSPHRGAGRDRGAQVGQCAARRPPVPDRAPGGHLPGRQRHRQRRDRVAELRSRPAGPHHRLPGVQEPGRPGRRAVGRAFPHPLPDDTGGHLPAGQPHRRRDRRPDRRDHRLPRPPGVDPAGPPGGPRPHRHRPDLHSRPAPR